MENELLRIEDQDIFLHFSFLRLDAWEEVIFLQVVDEDHFTRIDATQGVA